MTMGSYDAVSAATMEAMSVVMAKMTSVVLTQTQVVVAMGIPSMDVQTVMVILMVVVPRAMILNHHCLTHSIVR